MWVTQQIDLKNSNKQQFTYTDCVISKEYLIYSLFSKSESILCISYLVYCYYFELIK